MHFVAQVAQAQVNPVLMKFGTVIVALCLPWLGASGKGGRNNVAGGKGGGGGGNPGPIASAHAVHASNGTVPAMAMCQQQQCASNGNAPAMATHVHLFHVEENCLPKKRSGS